MRFFLFILMALVVVTSLSAGLLMLFSFDYSSPGLNSTVFGANTFENYFVLILILVLVIGGDGLLAIFLLLVQNPASYKVAMVAGVSIIVWIGVDLLFDPSFHWLQGFYLVIGILISLTSYRLMEKEAL